ncbi:hypothetical protein Lalb_Chr12g0206001 [Lupinus albus]|uniref:Uncharacterized protein n=1 Tax=Lupinus albus TaxID=3870 RepID=A0A6A4PNM7_LUPAL|nr:hypothetical protein Lalb_Chr12g0206001 [Lupinus albus]
MWFSGQKADETALVDVIGDTTTCDECEEGNEFDEFEAYDEDMSWDFMLPRIEC